MTIRLTARHRRQQIIEAAKTLSYDTNLYHWTLADIAAKVGITLPGVKYYFYSAVGLRKEILIAAINTNDAALVVQAVVMKDPLTDEISEHLRDLCQQELKK